MSGAAPLHDQGAFQPLAGAAGAATVFDCALCGARFTHAEKTCGSCPMNHGCEVVRCPNCGYQFPRESALLNFVGRLLRRARRA